MNQSPLQASPAISARTLHHLQVRAFLQAAEDVNVDAETVADLLDGVTESFEDDDDSGPNDDDIEEEDGLEELDISALYDSHEQSENYWTHQETRGMLHHLKEKGIDSFICQYVVVRQIPIPKLLYAFGVALCPELRNKRPNTLLYFLRVALSHELSLRNKLPQYNTLADAVSLISNARRIVILTGAGISVSCGIPDFRSRDGLYASLKDEVESDLDDPQQMFDITYFKRNPAVFYSFAREIYPSNFIPSPCHRFIKLVEMKGKLLRNYTQNIDTLETLAGVERVLQCHGSFARATCVQCKRNVPGREIEEEIMRGEVPLCTVCNPSQEVRNKGKKKRRKHKTAWDSEDDETDRVSSFPPGVMKPDITFFGEKLTTDFDHALLADREVVDLLLVIGTSLKVAPVSDILSHLPHSVPQILINKTPVRHINPDIVLLGNADDIILYLCRELGWDLPPAPPAKLLAKGDRLQPTRVNIKKRPSEDALDDPQPRRVGNSHAWLFKGSEGGKWLQDLERTLADCQRSDPDLSDEREIREAKKVKVQR